MADYTSDRLVERDLDQATGMLMGYYRVDADQALDVLTWLALDTGVDLPDIAVGILVAGALLDPNPYGALHALLHHLNPRPPSS